MKCRQNYYHLNRSMATNKLKYKSTTIKCALFHGMQCTSLTLIHLFVDLTSVIQLGVFFSFSLEKRGEFFFRKQKYYASSSLYFYFYFVDGCRFWFSLFHSFTVLCDSIQSHRFIKYACARRYDEEDIIEECIGEITMKPLKQNKVKWKFKCRQ